MLYIRIPTKMKFEQLKSEQGVIVTLHDYFIERDEKDNIKCKISVQDAVKEYLQHRDKSKSGRCVNGIEIFFKMPPDINEDFLKYKPERNGKLPCQEYDLVNGHALNAYKRSSSTRYGTLWFNQYYFSKEKLAEIHEKRAEQRDNRRHIGDCPCPT